MLNWENFVIQQEKMKRLREDITELLSKAEAKLSVIGMKNQELKQSVQFLNQVCHIVM